MSDEHKQPTHDSSLMTRSTVYWLPSPREVLRMLSEELNEKLTRVGPGTPMGELMRRYWHPIAAMSQLDENPTKAVRLLGEDLVLYKDRSGTLGLIGDQCPHRKVNLL